MTDNRLDHACECCLSANVRLFDMKQYQFATTDKPISYFDCYTECIDPQFLVTESQSDLRPKVCMSCAQQLRKTFMFRATCLRAQKLLTVKRNQARTENRKIDDRKNRVLQPLVMSNSSSTTRSSNTEEMSTAECSPPQPMDEESPESELCSDDYLRQLAYSQTMTIDEDTPRPTEEIEIDETDEEEQLRREAAREALPIKRKRKTKLDTQVLFSSDEESSQVFREFQSWY